MAEVQSSREKQYFNHYLTLKYKVLVTEILKLAGSTDTSIMADVSSK